MKMIYIQGKRTSERRARNIVKQIYGSDNFKSCYKRGEVHLYFNGFITEKQVKQIAKELDLEIVKCSSVRAILDVK